MKDFYEFATHSPIVTFFLVYLICCMVESVFKYTFGGKCNACKNRPNKPAE